MEIKRGSFSNPDDERLFKHFDFNNDPEIPVVLVYPVRWHKEQFEVLFMRRGFKVGAYRGLWSPIAGVDDFYVEDDEEAGSLLSCVDELDEEAGFTAKSEEIKLIAKNPRQCLEKASRTWLQKLYFWRNDELDTVRLNWENIGAMWVPVSSVIAYAMSRQAVDDEMRVIMRDGTPMVEEGTLKLFADYCREHLVEPV